MSRFRRLDGKLVSASKMDGTNGSISGSNSDSGMLESAEQPANSNTDNAVSKQMANAGVIGRPDVWAGRVDVLYPINRKLEANQMSSPPCVVQHPDPHHLIEQWCLRVSAVDAQS